MNSEEEEGSSPEDGYAVSTPSITDDDSDADLATVLTQLIRRLENQLNTFNQNGFI